AGALATGTAATAAAETAEDPAEDVFGGEGIAVGSRGRPAEGARAAARLRTSLTESLEAFESLELRLAVGADLAAVELGPLLLVADDLVGGIDLGEAVLRLRIGLVLVGMKLLGQL